MEHIGDIASLKAINGVKVNLRDPLLDIALKNLTETDVEAFKRILVMMGQVESVKKVNPLKCVRKEAIKGPENDQECVPNLKQG